LPNHTLQILGFFQNSNISPINDDENQGEQYMPVRQEIFDVDAGLITHQI
jgi:hypothetical protein